MKKVLQWFFVLLIRLAMRLRYKITVKGLDKITPDRQPKEGGVLFLPNHPAVFVDPAAVTLPIWGRYPVRPLVTDYVFYTPVIHYIMRAFGALPIPDNEKASNSLKKRRSEQTLEEVAKGLERGENFLIYPSGRCKTTGIERVGGASGVHSILQKTQKVNIILVRIKGMWGSFFSKAYTYETPHVFPVLKKALWVILKNGIFFAPRRNITIEYELAPQEFPSKGSRLEINRWLERYYNRPDGLSEQVGDYPGETMVRVPYSFWNKKDLIEPLVKEEVKKVDVDKVSRKTKELVKAKLGEMCDRSPDQICPEDYLSANLGLDSLDIGDVAIWLETQFDVEGVPVRELDTAGKVMLLAEGLVTFEQDQVKEKGNKGWTKKRSHKRAHTAKGKTMPEVFLNICREMGSNMAVGDDRSGVMTYSSLKMRVLLLAQYFRTLPGKKLGIMLPSSVAATISVLAAQLAGKIPVMINWTVGPRHLEAVKEVSGMSTVITSWGFIDRLTNVDTTPIDEMMLMLEDLVAEISIFAKLRAAVRAKLPHFLITKIFGVDKMKEDDLAVILFTSGSESQPKGVPLTHFNLLCNQKAGIRAFDIYSDDILLSILPPFHSFGFNVTSLIGLLAGVRTAYVADPTDGNLVARSCLKWSATMVAGAPTFLKKMLTAGEKEQFKTLRYIITGAEKAPAKLFELVESLDRDDLHLFEGYGITECSPILTAHRPGTENVGVGQPVENVEILIVHPETHVPMPIGEQGLILARGPNVFSGYLNKGLASPFVEVEGKEWYNTGDLGSMTEDNSLIISGRQKRFIKVGAEMVSLASIENALLEIAPKKGWKVAQEGPSLAVCAKEEESGKPDIFLFAKFVTYVDEVNHTLKEAGFSNLIKVSHVKEVEEIPIMGTGKINYRALESQFM